MSAAETARRDGLATAYARMLEHAAQGELRLLCVRQIL